MRAIAIICALIMSGCESIPIGGDRGLGTHTYSLTSDGFVLDTSSVRGGPAVEYEASDGAVRLKVTPGKEQFLLDILEAMQ